MTDTTIKPFRIAVGDDVLADLKSRLRHTRWPEAELVSDWSQGAPLAWIQEVCRYWADGLRLAQARGAAQSLRRNSPPTIDGLDIHFVHARSPHPEAMPLIITHGWPGSIVEFHKVIEPLTNPTAHGGIGRRRLPCGVPVAAGLRLLRQAEDHRVGRRPHRRGPGSR